MKSIITDDMNHCFLCGSSHWIEIHHIFGGANRDKSTEYGLIVPLCHYCHNEPPNGVHHNSKRMKYLRQLGQAKFETTYQDKDFIQIFGKNYL